MRVDMAIDVPESLQHGISRHAVAALDGTVAAA
jgi:hypothetical protein